MEDGESSKFVVPSAQRSRARAILKKLPAGTHDLTIGCPLCGTDATARGLTHKLLRGATIARWELLFTCPACGLITAFDTELLTPDKIGVLRGSPWAMKLRHFHHDPASTIPGYTKQAGVRQFVGALIVAYIAWLLLIGNFNPLELLWGFIVSLGIARFTYKFANIDLPVWMLSPSRWLALGQLTLEFIRQLVVQNITLSIRVLRPKLSIRPGIVAIPTKLRDDVALTILGSLVSLTPDTVTMDIDQERGILYVHWIDVQTMDQAEAQRMISASLEEKIIRWLV